MAGEVSLSHYRKDVEEMDLHLLPSPVWRWKHLTATVVWLLPGLGRDINSSHLKKGVEGGCMVGVGRKRRYITGIIRGYAKASWETKDNKKQQASLSRTGFWSSHALSSSLWVLPLQRWLVSSCSSSCLWLK